MPCLWKLNKLWTKEIFVLVTYCVWKYAVFLIHLKLLLRAEWQIISWGLIYWWTSCSRLGNIEGSINPLQVNGSHPENISVANIWLLSSLWSRNEERFLAMPNTSYSNGINRFRFSPLTCSVTLDKSSELTCSFLIGKENEEMNISFLHALGITDGSVRGTVIP